MQQNQGPLPIEISRLSGTALVAEVVMVPELTPLLQAAQTRGFDIVTGREMSAQQFEAGMNFLGMTA
jgi:shikimate dehydrogenase